MIMEINFDMDGTLADFYGTTTWAEDILDGNLRPYSQARPMINFSALARQIHRLQKKGYNVNIISWLSKKGTPEYNERVAQVKEQWLQKHLPSVEFNTISIVNYGIPKQELGKGILFDDSENVRNDWEGVAFDERNILEILRSL